MNNSKNRTALFAVLLSVAVGLLGVWLRQVVLSDAERETDMHFVVAALDREIEEIRLKTGVDISIDEFLAKYPSCCQVKRMGPIDTIFSHAVEVHLTYEPLQAAKHGKDEFMDVYYLMNGRGDQAARFSMLTK